MLGLLFAIPGIGPVYTIVANAIGFVLRCTACMFVIIAGVAWIAGGIHGHRKESAAWSAKWQAAEAQAELDRLKRDALAKIKIEAAANQKIEGIGARAAQLETKVQRYEQEEALRRATAGTANRKGGVKGDDCLTDASDDQWLLDIRRGKDVKSKARRGLTERLRARLKGSPDPGER